MYLQSPLLTRLPITIFAILIISYLSSLKGFSQEISVRANLPEEIKESSGLIYVQDMLFTHTDSDGPASLFQIDLETNQVIRKIDIQNAKNIDWEDVAFDEQYVYIADVGNNMGNRSDLKIYKILISELVNPDTTSLMSENINFSYANQNDFSINPYDTNFDAETLICYNDNLYIFTKNWSDLNTNVYKLSTEPGNYNIELVDSLEIGGLIAAGIYNPSSDEVVLCGYTEDNAFVMTLSDIVNERFSESRISKTDLSIPENISYQVEGITYLTNTEYILSSETGVFGTGAFINFNVDNTLDDSILEKATDSIYPNPAKEYLNIQFQNFKSATILNSEGKIILKTKNRKIYVGDLAPAIYIIRVEGRNNMSSSYKLLKE